MSERARVKENSDFIKNLDSMAILNTNKSAVAKHEQKMAEIRRIKQTEQEINNLKSEVSEMKDLLSKILNAVEGGK